MSNRKNIAPRFLLEIASIFLGVTIAFLANHWNEQRKEKIIERNVLQEIYAELQLDIADLSGNRRGHELGIRAVNLFESFSKDEPVGLDTMGSYFERMYRDYISLTNTTAYENLRSRGFELIKNEKLRSDILLVYDYNYEAIKKLEEDYYPAQFHANYFEKIMEYFGPYIEIENNNIRVVRPFRGKADAELLLIFKEIRQWRYFSIQAYDAALKAIEQLREDIKKELDS